MKKLIQKLKIELEANPELGFVLGSLTGLILTIAAILVWKYS